MSFDARVAHFSGHAYSPAGELLLSRRRAARGPSKRATLESFRSAMWEYWRENGRHDLPWRKTADSYKILVSEVMLQQTQVHRVIPKYGAFLEKFPTLEMLAKAPLADVLKVWSGLGYNRRAKYLHDAAKMIAEKYGKVPQMHRELIGLPGVGDYTARAIRVFAYGKPEVLIETNIRTALIHTLYPGDTSITDQDLMTLLSKVIDGHEPRKFYWALMDYGAHLKRSGVRNNHRSKHYTKQSKFEGSLRQMRGMILHRLTDNDDVWFRKPNIGFKRALDSLERDGLIEREKGKWRLPAGGAGIA